MQSNPKMGYPGYTLSSPRTPLQNLLKNTLPEFTTISRVSLSSIKISVETMVGVDDLESDSINIVCVFLG